MNKVMRVWTYRNVEGDTKTINVRVECRDEGDNSPSHFFQGMEEEVTDIREVTVAPSDMCSGHEQIFFTMLVQQFAVLDDGSDALNGCACWALSKMFGIVLNGQPKL
jgi:hypothetical protein